MKTQVQIYTNEVNQCKYDRLGSISCVQRTAKYRKISESWNLNYIVLAGYLFSNNSSRPSKILSQRTRVLLLLALVAALVKRRNVLMESVILQLQTHQISPPYMDQIIMMARTRIQGDQFLKKDWVNAVVNGIISSDNN
jgi:hypothetical protein